MLECLQQADEQLMLFLNGFHTPFWDNFMWIYTGKWIWVPMYAMILYVLCKNFKPGACILTVVAIALTITFADQVCATLIRPLVERMRPSNVNNPLSEMIHILNGKRGGRYGFPSCHASNSFALAFFLLFLFKDRMLSLFIILWATLNCYTRIYSGVHYPGDLLAGMLVGLCGAFLIYRLYRIALRNPRIAALIKYDNVSREIIEGKQPAHYTRFIIYTGLVTIFAFSLYSWIIL